MWQKNDSGDSEWCSTAPIPPPNGIRMTIDARNDPAVRKPSLATWEMIWSNAGKTNPSNWISTTGR